MMNVILQKSEEKRHHANSNNQSKGTSKLLLPDKAVGERIDRLLWMRILNIFTFYQFPGLYFSAHTPAGALHKSLSKNSILTLPFTAFQILLNQTLLVPWGRKPPVSPMAEWTPGWQCDQRPCRGVSTASVPFVMSQSARWQNQLHLSFL